ncbi:MAG: tyrosine-type recombinase/integrase [Alphaproteobacteria bacterium]|nr:tyrosine-type recombinase/integrase [Alphaproteobacteria bacterium]OJV46641.1 MAG: hypothetical protein BGO28_04750 [Alphaproteobacteria bacterium 43-37]
MISLKEGLASFDDWMSHEKYYSLNTQKAYKADILEALIFFNQGQLPLDHPIDTLSFNKNLMRSWLATRLKQGKSHRSNARALSSIKTMLGFFVKRHHLTVDDRLLSMPSPRFGKSLPKALLDQQITSILPDNQDTRQTWVFKRNIALLILLYGAGLRISEALALFQNDFGKDTLIIRGKGNKERLVPILPIIKQAIEDYLAAQPFLINPQSPLFLSQKGKRLNPGVFQRFIRSLRRAHHLPETFTPHALRHTFATELLRHNIDLRTLQSLLGHASLSTTQNYTAISDPDLQRLYQGTHPRNRKSEMS